MRKARSLSLFAVVGLALTLICMVGIPGGWAAELSPVTVLRSFLGSSASPSDGAEPIYGSLTLVGKTTLCGMTKGGGADNNGTIFMFNTTTGKETVLYSFTGYPDGAHPYGSLTLSGTTLYGMTEYGGAYDCGTIFKVNTNGTGYEVLYSFAGDPDGDGAWPYGSLTISGKQLFAG